MNHTTILINILAGSALIFSVVKDRRKTLQGLVIAYKTFLRILPTVLLVLLLVALIMGFINNELISGWLGGSQNGLNIVISAILGSILMIPSIIGFPLAASLLQKGASVMAIATFITTLTMIGFVTLPLEIKELGPRFTFWRNGLSLVVAISIGVLIGVIL